jgi:hypothetical protein
VGYAHVPRASGATPAATSPEHGPQPRSRSSPTASRPGSRPRAPGFRDRILARHVLGPPAMQELNPSLVHVALNVGTAQLYQQLIFRPTPGLGRPTTPVKNVYLASGVGPPRRRRPRRPGRQRRHPGHPPPRLARAPQPGRRTGDRQTMNLATPLKHLHSAVRDITSGQRVFAGRQALPQLSVRCSTSSQARPTRCGHTTAGR